MLSVEVAGPDRVRSPGGSGRASTPGTRPPRMPGPIGTQGEEGWLFFRGSDRINRNSAGNYWRNTREDAELPEEYTLHDLRHFYASALIAAGCDVVTVQRALGHKSATITLGVYAHLWSDRRGPHAVRRCGPHG